MNLETLVIYYFSTPLYLKSRNTFSPRVQHCLLLFFLHCRLMKTTFAKLKGDLMKNQTEICRINAKISKQNYFAIDDLMKSEHLISMKLSKGAILDIAVSCLINALQHETLESLAIQHLARIEDDNVNRAIAGETV